MEFNSELQKWIRELPIIKDFMCRMKALKKETLEVKIGNTDITYFNLICEGTEVLK